MSHLSDCIVCGLALFLDMIHEEVPLRLPFIIAHRGASYDAPENTLAAIRLAWQQQADAVEIDVQMSRDGQIVVFHDTHTWRLGRRLCYVRWQSLRQLKQLDVGIHKSQDFSGERIPTLHEALSFVPPDKKIFIEIKCGKQIAPALKEIVRSSALAAWQIQFIAFDQNVASLVKSILPEHSVLLLFDPVQNHRHREWRPSLAEMLADAKETQADGLDVRACAMIDQSFAQRVKEAGLKLYVWTVNDSAEAWQLTKLPVDGITTDRPLWLRERLSEME